MFDKEKTQAVTDVRFELGVGLQMARRYLVNLQPRFIPKKFSSISILHQPQFFFGTSN